MKFKNTLINIAKGACIGLACIVPGVSGGTLAVILNLYDKILAAISNIRKDFKNSLKFLWPILLGIVIGLGSMVYPIKIAFEHFPLPTILLFVGLIIGSLPGISKNISRKPTIPGIIAMILAMGLAVGLCFIGAGTDADLSVNMPWYTYLIVILIGMVGSCALAVPGISGSMLLLILGFYTPILNCVTSIVSGTDVGHNILTLLCFAVGVVIGFFVISKIMTFFLRKFKYQTYMAIIGFIVASIFAIFYQIKDNMIPEGAPWAVILVGVILFLIGLTLTSLITFFANKYSKKEKTEETKKIQETDQNAN